MQRRNDLLKAFQEKKADLRPTATVVRGRNGKVTVERDFLISLEERRARIEASETAGKLRKGLPEHLALRTSQQHDLPLISGIVYSCELDQDGSAGSWTPAATTCSINHENTSQDAPHTCISVVTFNVWFAEYEWEERLNALIDLLKANNATVACLQEVTAKFLTALMNNPYIREKYRLAVSFAPTCWYGVAMLVDKETLPMPVIETVQLPTKMGRMALIASFFEKQSWSIAIATVHLESLKSRPIRSYQLECIKKHLEKHPTALLVGDMNITGTGPFADVHEDESVTSSLLPGFADCWVTNHTHEKKDSMDGNTTGATFDTELNPMLKERTRFADSARYDRALFKEAYNNGSSWSFDSISIIGTKPFASDSSGRPLLISDHFGLSLRLILSQCSSGQNAKIK